MSTWSGFADGMRADSTDDARSVTDVLRPPHPQRDERRADQRRDHGRESRVGCCRGWCSCGDARAVDAAPRCAVAWVHTRAAVRNTRVGRRIRGRRGRGADGRACLDTRHRVGGAARASARARTCHRRATTRALTGALTSLGIGDAEASGEARRRVFARAAAAAARGGHPGECSVLQRRTHHHQPQGQRPRSDDSLPLEHASDAHSARVSHGGLSVKRQKRAGRRRRA